jgi:hypothetical protein
MVRESGPEMRTTAIADLPGGVERAKIVGVEDGVWSWRCVGCANGRERAGAR